MYLGSKYLDAHYLMDDIKLLSVDFLHFCFFSLFHAYLELKSIHCSTSFCHRKDSQFDRKKEMETMRDKKE